MQVHEHQLRLWHNRFGHQNRLHRTIYYQGVMGLLPHYADLRIIDEFCVHCLKEKQCKCDHTTIKCTARKVGEILHVDISTKSVQSLSKNIHVLMIIEHGCSCSKFDED